MEFFILFKLIAYLFIKAEKSDYRPSLRNHYSNNRNTPSTKFYPISATHTHFVAIQHGNKKAFKSHVKHVFDDIINVQRIISATDPQTLIKIMDELSQYRSDNNDEVLIQRIVIYLNIVRTMHHLVFQQKVASQFDFIYPVNDNIRNLINKLEDQMILNNNIQLVRAINACQAKTVAS
ncbi:MAG: hypothetical protein ACI8ZM_003517 [Crocinitomix sp.]|jgi:hypothetical protein